MKKVELKIKYSEEEYLNTPIWSGHSGYYSHSESDIEEIKGIKIQRKVVYHRHAAPYTGVDDWDIYEIIEMPKNAKIIEEKAYHELDESPSEPGIYIKDNIIQIVSKRNEWCHKITIELK